MNLVKKILTRFVIPLAVIGVAIVFASVLLSMKPEAEKVPVEEVAILVEVMTVQLGASPAVLHTTGTVSAARRTRCWFSQ